MPAFKHIYKYDEDIEQQQQVQEFERSENFEIEQLQDDDYKEQLKNIEFFEQEEDIEQQQKQMQEFERSENFEIEQLQDDDYKEQLKNIEFFEQEEEEICQKRYYHEMQSKLKELEQLEQLEKEQQSEDLRQVFYYEWMQQSQLVKKEQILPMQSMDLVNTPPRQSAIFNKKKQRISHSNDNENEQKNVLNTTFLHKIQQQQGNEEENTFVLARTLEEKSYFLTNQSTFNTTTKFIKRTIKHTNVLCICSEDQWKRQVNNYMKESGGGIFSLLGDMTSETSTNDAAKHILVNMSNLVVRTLHHLLYRRLITNEQYSDMMYYNQSIQFNVNKLDFRPKLRNNKIIIEPIIKCSTIEPMKGILHLINNLLQPLTEEKFHTKTFPTANEAIEKLIRYSNDFNLQPTTFFVTIHIHDLRTTLPHHLMIEALYNFFNYFVHNQEINGISTSTIIQLIQLILENQFCIYENKLYQQTCGSSINSPLITTLIDIYLFYWQYDLLRQLNMMKNRFFGRCLNHIFFTWNESKDKLVSFLNEKNLTHSKHAAHIQMTVLMDNYKVQYLDAEISHIHGFLQTKVYHHSNFEPYTLPYLLSKTRTSQSSHQVLLRAALFRAILYCSNVREFENEQLFIELSFLLNNVSLYFIQKITENFFIEFNIDHQRDKCIDEGTYAMLRLHIRENYQQQSKYHLRPRQRQSLVYLRPRQRQSLAYL